MSKKWNIASSWDEIRKMYSSTLPRSSEVIEVQCTDCFHVWKTNRVLGISMTAASYICPQCGKTDVVQLGESVYEYLLGSTYGVITWDRTLHCFDVMVRLDDERGEIIASRSGFQDAGAAAKWAHQSSDKYNKSS